MHRLRRRLRARLRRACNVVLPFAFGSLLLASCQDQRLTEPRLSRPSTRKDIVGVTPTDMPSQCGHWVTGIAFDGTYYYVGEGHNSLFQCISRYSATGIFLDKKTFAVDIRGLHYVSATGKLVSRTWGGALFQIDYESGTQTQLTGFDAVGVPGLEQSQPAADPDGQTFWVMNPTAAQAERHSLADNSLIQSFPVSIGATSTPEIAVSRQVVFIPNGSLLELYDKVTGTLLTTQAFALSGGCSGAYGFGVSASGDRVMYNPSCTAAHVESIHIPTTPPDLPNQCGHAITGIAFDGAFYYVGEGHESLYQCISRYSAWGTFLDKKTVAVDIRGLHYVPATGKLVSRTWNGPLYAIDYAAGTQVQLTGFNPTPGYGSLPGVDQSQPAADPDGQTFWLLDVPNQQAVRRRLSDNADVQSFAVTGGVLGAPAIAVSATAVFVPNGTVVNVYDKSSGALLGAQTMPSSTAGCSGYGFGSAVAGDRVAYSSSCTAAHVEAQAISIPSANRPPIANPGGPYSVIAGQPLTLDGSGSSDPDGDPVTYTWTFGDGQNATLTSPSVSHTYANPGTYTATLVATDRYGLSSAPQAATVTAASPDPGYTTSGSDVQVIPVDQTTGQSAPVALTFDQVTTSGSTSVTSGQVGSNSTPGAPPAPTSANFRLGSPPLYYNIATTATFTGAVQVCVTYPDGAFKNTNNLQLLHYDGTTWQVLPNQTIDTSTRTVCAMTTSFSPFLIAQTEFAPVVTQIALSVSPVPINTMTVLQASFTDQNAGDTHSATFGWTGGAGAGTISESNGSGNATLQAAFGVPGVYTITATVSDGDRTGTRSSASDVPSYLVVYDPKGGFVTGGGWIDSPANACQWSGCAPDGSTIGKATFGFESRYQKGTTTPGGATQFQFKTGGLSFTSTSYDWLVVSGSRAQFKGQGTMNGTGSYGFLLTAIDGQISGGGGVDRFRIKIWDLATSAIVYDNQLGAPDNTTDPPTALGGGSIQIHQ